MALRGCGTLAGLLDGNGRKRSAAAGKKRVAEQAPGADKPPKPAKHSKFWESGGKGEQRGGGGGGDLGDEKRELPAVLLLLLLPEAAKRSLAHSTGACCMVGSPHLPGLINAGAVLVFGARSREGAQ